jgi:hypothetical protein
MAPFIAGAPGPLVVSGFFFLLGSDAGRVEPVRPLLVSAAVPPGMASLVGRGLCRYFSAAAGNMRKIFIEYWYGTQVFYFCACYFVTGVVLDIYLFFNKLFTFFKKKFAFNFCSTS